MTTIHAMTLNLSQGHCFKVPGANPTIPEGHGRRKYGLSERETGLNDGYSGTMDIHSGNPRVNSFPVKSQFSNEVQYFEG